ncbi:MAG: serine hydrolase [Chloroflexi bacterium]|nr:serine hydrolase [Chloroflexota bacterium]
MSLWSLPVALVFIATILVVQSKAHAQSAVMGTGHTTKMTQAPHPTPLPTIAALITSVESSASPTLATPPPTATPEPTVTPTPVSPFFSASWLQSHPPASPPPVSAAAVVVVDYDTRQILYEKNPHEHLAQASTTKITLADVALDVASPDLPITISQDATQVIPDHMGVQAGEVLTLKELLYGALLNSGNDAGWAIAEGIGGLQYTVSLMNQRVAALNLHDTHFVNPVGFDNPNHYTSAYDLAVLTVDALQRHPLIRQIVSTKHIIIDSTKTHGWFGPTNLNNLLWDYPGDWGVKTGWTEKAGYCFVTAATRDGHTVLVTLLDSKASFPDGVALLNYGFSRIAEETPAPS